MKQGFKILVVEDSQDLLNLWKAFFKALNCESHYCRDYKSAVKMTGEEGLNPDILMTDYFLPDGTGEDLAREVQKLHPDTKILFVTGNQEKDIRERVETMGRVLIKPVRFNALREALTDLVG